MMATIMGLIVPIYIANPKPFRLILRDVHDTWDANLEDINRRSYNYIKLHRLSKFIRAEVEQNYPLSVAFDGSFILPVISEYQSIKSILNEFNRIFASILLGGVYIESIEAEDLSQGQMTEVGYFRHTRTFGGNGVIHQELCNKDVSSSGALCLLEPPTILASDIQSAYSYGAKILKAIDNLSPSLFITGFTYFIKSQIKESLTHSWISIEQVIDNIWHSTIINESRNAQIPKRQKFLESQQWTTAHKSEVLFQKSIISADTYKEINNVRAARNKFIHKGEDPPYGSAKSALHVLIELIECSTRLIGEEFNKILLQKYLADPAPEERAGHVIDKAENIDWSQVQYWAEAPAIPGDEKWKGEFESYIDITIKARDDNVGTD